MICCETVKKCSWVQSQAWGTKKAPNFCLNFYFADGIGLSHEFGGNRLLASALGFHALSYYCTP